VPVVAAGSCGAERVGLAGPVTVAGSVERWAAGRGAAEEMRVRAGRVVVERGVAERAVVGVGCEEVGRARVVVGTGRAAVDRGARVVGALAW
jgi:hypothetical protein